MKIAWTLLIVLGLVVGCSGPDEGADTPAEGAPETGVLDRDPSQNPDGATDKIIEEITGARAVRQGRTMKQKLDKINADHNKQLQEALGEETE
jgi:hypothetical protein